MLLRRCLSRFSPNEAWNIKCLKSRQQKIYLRSLCAGSTAVEHNSVSKEGKKSKKKSPDDILFPKYFTGAVKKPDIENTNLYVSHRTHNCGQLRKEHVGQKVTLAGWLQFHRVEGKFLVLRDGYGSTQIFFPKQKAEWDVGNLKLESVIKVTGTVINRPNGQQNPKMATGDIELEVEDFELLSPAKNQLPITVKDHAKATELLRMTYRYLDLRFPEMQSRLRFRSTIISEMRKFLGEKCGFVEVETPTLFKRTPGGAQEFIVPSRMAGKCYTLVQSPQQFKQLLMVGGIDRYFQVARCYRDETARPDRQVEFTQLDIELSFTNQQGVMAMAEDLISQCWRATVQPDLPFDKFPIMKFDEAFRAFGSDKPDVRFDMKITNIFEDVKPMSDLCSPPLRSLLESENGTMGAIIIPKGQDVWSSNKSISKLASEQLKHFNSSLWLRGFRVPNVQSDPWPSIGEDSKISETLKTKLGPKCNPGDIVWVAAGPRTDALTLLGRLRTISADELEKSGMSIRCKGPSFLWVVDFPLFEPGEQPGSLKPSHHPFTHPHPEDEHLLFTDPLKVRGQHYDLVLDGWEIAGGSVRIHNSEMQRRVLGDLLKIRPDSLQHMLDALDSGCPPHAGIAFGIDRLIAVACGAPSIRDVIAFPKAAGGRDPMSGAPVDMTQEDQALYHIHCLAKN